MVLISALDSVLGGVGKHRYSFMPQAEFDSLVRADPPKANQIYWLEILYRAHFSALTALVRTSRWIRGVLAAYREPNLLSFAASYRGLIEAAADTQDAFGLAAPTIAEYFGNIRIAVEGRATAFHIVDRLEDTLIHFMHARRLRKGETAPPSHKTKDTRDYLAVLKRGCGDEVLTCYAELCNLTHPAGPSVLAFARQHDGGSLIEYWPAADRTRISDFCSRHQTVALEILMFGINNALVMLKLLNRFSHHAIRTPVMEQVDLSQIPAWVKAERRAAESDPGPQ